MATTFTARTVSGKKMGRKIGYPTMNLEASDVPAELEHGIFAAWVIMDNPSRRGRAATDGQWTMEKHPAVVHYGAHPAFKDARVTFEVHCLDKCNAARRSRAADVTLAGVLTVEIVQKIRDVQDFSDVEALRKQIAKDCATARAILGSP